MEHILLTWIVFILCKSLKYPKWANTDQIEANIANILHPCLRLSTPDTFKTCLMGSILNPWRSE